MDGNALRKEAVRYDSPAFPNEEDRQEEGFLLCDKII
jgi:hypothetical protein